MLMHGSYYCNLHSMRSWFKRNAPHCHFYTWQRDVLWVVFSSSGSTRKSEEGGQGAIQSAAAIITVQSTMMRSTTTSHALPFLCRPPVVQPPTFPEEGCLDFLAATLQMASCLLTVFNEEWYHSYSLSGHWGWVNHFCFVALLVPAGGFGGGGAIIKNINTNSVMIN